MGTLEVKNLSYTYGKGAPYEIKALDDVSLTFDGGMITGLIGHTGRKAEENTRHKVSRRACDAVSRVSAF